MPLKKTPHPETHLGLFRFKRLGQAYLLTQETGRFFYLQPSDFSDLVSGEPQRLKRKKPRLFGDLLRQGFLYQDDSRFIASETSAYQQKKSYLARATSLHIVVVTLRCDHQCVYCQANAGLLKDRHLDMDIKTARKVVDRIFESPAGSLTIEFQGGEPLANLPTVKFIIRYAKMLNKTAGKHLHIVMVTNLSLMNTATMNYLMLEGVSLCTSLDGPAWLHERYRRRADGSSGSHAKAAHWVQEINRLNKEGRYQHRIGALLTATRQTLQHPVEVIDEYRRLGLRSIFLRTMTTFAAPATLPAQESYGPDEFFDFYRRSMEYILALNKKGESFVERKTLILLAKIFDARDPDFMDLRSPCGAAIGQLAYNYNGDVYTCDEGRMLARCQDDTFCLGNVFKNSYAAMMKHATVSAMCVASCLENLPGCHDCAYAPYCGVCPLVHYKRYGSLFRPHKYSDDCSLNEKILDFIFQKCQNKEDKKIFLSWLNMPPQKRDAV
jgi:uncharacterized protein